MIPAQDDAHAYSTLRLCVPISVRIHIKLGHYFYFNALLTLFDSNSFANEE